MNIVKAEGALMMPQSQPCVHKVSGHGDEGEPPHGWEKDAERCIHLLFKKWDPYTRWRI